MATANLKAKISLDTSAFSRGIQSVRAQVSSVASSIQRIGAVAGAAVAGLGAISSVALAKGVKDALEYGSALSDLAARTGAPAKDLAIIHQTFKDAGIDAAAVGSNFNRLQKALQTANDAGSAGGKIFQQLGLDIAALKASTPVEQFQKIGSAIAALNSPTERAAAAMAIFGKSGGELLAVFNDPQAFGNAAKIIGSQADILGRNAAKFDEISDKFNSIGVKFRGFFVGVAESLIPALSKTADALAGLDLAPLGQRLGNAISSAVNIFVNAFRSGQLGELVGLSIQTGLAIAANFFINSIRVGVEVIGQSLQRIFSVDFFSSLIVGFAGVGKKITAILLDAFQTPLSFLQAGIEFAIQEILNSLPDFAKDQLGISNVNKTFEELLSQNQERGGIGKLAKDFSSEGGALLNEAFGGLKAVGQDIRESLIENLKNFQPSDLFGESGLKEKLSALAESLNLPLEKVKEVVKKTIGDVEGTSLTPTFQKSQAASSLERIGAILGGGTSGAAINFARKTADNTTLIAKHLATLVQQKPGALTPVSVYGT